MQLNRPAWPNETSEWALTVVGGPSAGIRLAVGRAETMLGREAVGATLFQGDQAVSRRHAVVRVLDGTCVVEDHNSTNGTFVNDVPIDRPTVLGPEDELRIGATRLRLVPAQAGTALLAAVPALEPEAALWDGTTSGGPTAPQPGAVTETPATNGPRVHKAGKLALSILAAIAGTVLASALNGSPQLKLAAAALGSAVPAFVTEPGRYQRARVTAMVVLMAGALFVTYGGATLFSYATDRPPIYPVPPVVPPPAPKATATPTPTSPVSPTPTGPVSPAPTGPVSPTPTGPVSPAPTGPVSPASNGPVSPTPTTTPTSFTGTSGTPPPGTPTPAPTGP